jgi:hypothetical protein
VVLRGGGVLCVKQSLRVSVETRHNIACQASTQMHNSRIISRWKFIQEITTVKSPQKKWFLLLVQSVVRLQI